MAQEIMATLPYHFTLAAVNATFSNANLTGVPLVLGQDGKSKATRIVRGDILISTYHCTRCNFWNHVPCDFRS